MKKIFSLIGFLGCFTVGMAQLADPSVDLKQLPAVAVGTTTSLPVTVSNEGTAYDGNDVIKAKTLRVIITVGSDAKILGLSSNSDSRFTINDTIYKLPGNTIVLDNTGGDLVPQYIPDGSGGNAADASGWLARIMLNVQGLQLNNAESITANVYYYDNAEQGDVNVHSDGTNSEIGQFSIVASLPVHLISFAGQKANNYSVINWVYDNPVNFSHFELQRSSDGFHFSNLTNKQYKPAGLQSGIPNKFTETDVAPFSGDNYYRLKMIDIDGHFIYSNIVKLNFPKQANGLSLYPNPAVSQVTIETTNLSRQGKIKIYSANGAVVLQAVATTTKTQLNVSGLSQGFYVAKIIDDQGKLVGTTTFLKIK